MDPEGRLVWDVNLVQVQRRITLTAGQTWFARIGLIAAIIAALGAIAQGVPAAYDFGCRFHLWGSGCPGVR